MGKRKSPLSKKAKNLNHNRKTDFSRRRRNPFLNFFIIVPPEYTAFFIVLLIFPYRLSSAFSLEQISITIWLSDTC